MSPSPAAATNSRCKRAALLCTPAASHATPTRRHRPLRPPRSPGASESQLEETEQQLGYALPPALRVLYRVHDGQELEFDRQASK